MRFTPHRRYPRSCTISSVGLGSNVGENVGDDVLGAFVKGGSITNVPTSVEVVKITTVIANINFQYR
jgi:hypothetical protein